MSILVIQKSISYSSKDSKCTPEINVYHFNGVNDAIIRGVRKVKDTSGKVDQN
jgi:flagellar basal body-associated protein FliL